MAFSWPSAWSRSRGKGGAEVTLTDDEDGGMRLSYEVEANVRGKIAQIGARLIDAVAKKNADQFFAKIRQHCA